MCSVEAFLFSLKITTDKDTKVFEKRKIETKIDNIQITNN